jgi:hypothetical protein
MVTLTINSEEIASDLLKLFKIELLVVENNSYKKSYIIKYPDIDEHYNNYFIRRFFEGDGHFRYTKKSPVCGITSPSIPFLKNIIEKFELTSNINGIMIEICGNNALDFLKKIYVTVKNEIFYMNRKYNFYIKIKNWVPNITKE